jgi:hypothetical protein
MWKNVQKDYLPADQQQVLISVAGIYYISRFHADTGTFHVENDYMQAAFNAAEHLIYWIEYRDEQHNPFAIN